MRLPSAENATLLTAQVCPWRVSTSCPVCASHIFTVVSSLPDTMHLPSGLKHTQLTVPVCPFSTISSVVSFLARRGARDTPTAVATRRITPRRPSTTGRCLEQRQARSKRFCRPDSGSVGSAEDGVGEETGGGASRADMADLRESAGESVWPRQSTATGGSQRTAREGVCPSAIHSRTCCD